MRPTEFEWYGDDFPSVWDDFVPLVTAKPDRPARASIPWRQLDDGGVFRVTLNDDLTADVVLNDGRVVATGVEIPGGREQLIRILGGMMPPPRPHTVSYTITTSSTETGSYYVTTSNSSTYSMPDESETEPETELEPEPTYDSVEPMWDDWEIKNRPIVPSSIGVHEHGVATIRGP